jgi:hypothetical protein
VRQRASAHPSEAPPHRQGFQELNSHGPGFVKIGRSLLPEVRSLLWLRPIFTRSEVAPGAKYPPDRAWLHPHPSAGFSYGHLVLQAARPPGARGGHTSRATTKLTLPAHPVSLGKRCCTSNNAVNCMLLGPPPAVVRSARRPQRRTDPPRPGLKPPPRPPDPLFATRPHFHNLDLGCLR